MIKEKALFDLIDSLVKRSIELIKEPNENVLYLYPAWAIESIKAIGVAELLYDKDFSDSLTLVLLTDDEYIRIKVIGECLLKIMTFISKK
jgi:hypothetical protein